MGGGDLNMKKSWHPLLLKNQERVWLEEKKALEEKKKLDQLRKEKEEERQLQELQRLQEEQTGKKRTEKLEWMYSTPATGNSQNPNDLEDYLLGKKRVDKILTGDENAKLGASHKNFIAVQNANSVRDIASKIREDPLFAIKRQEQSSYETLMANPLRLREMQERNGIKPKRDKAERKREKEEKKRLKAEKKQRKLDRHRSPSPYRRRYDDDYDRRGRSRSRSWSPPPRREEPRFRDGRSSEDSPLEEDDRGRRGYSSRRSRSPMPTYSKRPRSPSPRDSRRRSPSPRDFRRRSPSPRDLRRRSPSPRDSRRRSPSPRDSRRRSPSPRDSRRRSPSPYSKQRSPSPRNSYSKRPRSPSPRDSYSKRPRRSPPPPRDPQPPSSRPAEDRAARLAAMSSDANTMSVERQERLKKLLEKEKAEYKAEEAARKKSKGMGDFISHEQKKVFGGAGGLEDRIRRGKGGMVIDAD